MSKNTQINVSTTTEIVNVDITETLQPVSLECFFANGSAQDTIVNVSENVLNIDLDVTETLAQNVDVDVIYPIGPIGPIGPMGPQGVNTWGSLTGTLSSQTDLWSYLSAGLGLNINALNDYLSTNSVFLCAATVYTDLSVNDSLYVSGSSTLVDVVSTGSDLYVTGTLYTGNTAIVLGTFFQTIGDGVNNTFNVTHNLGSQDIQVVVRDTATNLLVFPAIQPTDINNVNLSFNVVPAVSSYSVSIFAGVPSNKISAFKQELVIPPRPIANAFYVSVSGSDSNSGTEPSLPLRTIKKACQLAHNARVEGKNNPNIKYTVFVGTGDFYEDNPIYVAPNTSIIGDNLRRVSVFPKNKTYDMFWVDNSTYIWGFTFRGHLEPAAVIAFPNYKIPALTAIALSGLETPYVSPGVYKWRRPYITTSPYIQGSSSIAANQNGVAPGCGMRVDGSLAEGFLRSMVLDSYTQFNEGGRGIHILNNGYAQLVSIFTICCTEGMLCESGGTCSISNSNCSFGLSGIVARGKSPTPVLTGTLAGFVSNPDDPFVTTSLIVSGVDGTIIFQDSNYYPTLLNTPGVNLDTRKIAYAPYDGLIFNLNNDSNFYTVAGTPVSSSPGSFTITTGERINNTTLSLGSKVEFYIRSTIYASSHTFEFVGTGVELRAAIPSLGGVATPETEAIFNDNGAVFYTSTNHTGDFSIGEEFKVLQSSGTIQGNTFNRSILTLITPLTLGLE